MAPSGGTDWRGTCMHSATASQETVCHPGGPSSVPVLLQVLRFPCQLSCYQMLHSSYLSTGIGTMGHLRPKYQGTQSESPKSKKSARRSYSGATRQESNYTRNVYVLERAWQRVKSEEANSVLAYTCWNVYSLPASLARFGLNAY
jgi:hypothetical protein